MCCPVSLPKFGEGGAGLSTQFSPTPSFPLICAVQFPSPSLGRAGRGCSPTSYRPNRFLILVLSSFPPQVWGGQGGVVHPLLTDPIASSYLCYPVSLPKFGEGGAGLSTQFSPTPSFPNGRAFRIPSPSLGRAGRGCPRTRQRLDVTGATGETSEYPTSPSFTSNAAKTDGPPSTPSSSIPKSDSQAFFNTSTSTPYRNHKQLR
jgi:hypothetical protein